MKSCPQCGKTYNEGVIDCPDDKYKLVQIAEGSDPVLGKLLAGRFLLTEKLGQGGMGAVYKAIHTKIDRSCAIKLLTPFIADTESAAARFKREAKLASRIDNPHAVTIYDFGEAEGGMLYLAMEYIIGKPLSRLIEQESPLEVDRAVHITLQVASALSAAHKLGIVHRDLKPDNIMITRKEDDYDYVKVLDFGIAKTMSDIGVDNLTETGFVMGTPVYMSPEQVAGEKLDPRSDIYSLAIIVYEMLSRRIPFQGDNLQAVMISRLMRDPIRLRSVAPSVSEPIEREVMAGLARDREARTKDVKYFASQLNAVLYKGEQGLSSTQTDKITEKSPAQILAAPIPTNFVTDAPTLLRNVETPNLGQRYTGNITQKLLRRLGKLNWKHYTAVAVVLMALVGGTLALVNKDKGAAPQPAATTQTQTPPSTTSDQTAAQPADQVSASPKEQNTLSPEQAQSNTSAKEEKKPTKKEAKKGFFDRVIDTAEKVKKVIPKKKEN
jgi:serine/threonine protein kinase